MSDDYDDRIIAICGTPNYPPGSEQGTPPDVHGKCPKCGSEIASGYGLAFGGMGVYYYCDGEKECDWYFKIQDAEE